MKKQCSYHFIRSSLVLFLCREKVFVCHYRWSWPQWVCCFYGTMKSTQLFMKAIGLILPYNILASQREEWLFYFLSQLVKDVKLTFTVWVQTLAWCFMAFVRQLIHIKAAAWMMVSDYFQSRRREHFNWEMSVCRPYILLNFAYLLLIFQVFVNFAQHQHGEEDSKAYSNPVDITDELPLNSLQTSKEADKV